MDNARDEPLIVQLWLEKNGGWKSVGIIFCCHCRHSFSSVYLFYVKILCIYANVYLYFCSFVPNSSPK